MKKINIKKFKKYILPVSFFVVVFFVVSFDVVHAVNGWTATKNISTAIAAAPILGSLGAIAALMTVVVGSLDTLFISAITQIATYNKFITEPAIIDAWVIVRDVCNMFFVVVLLIIAFASILRYENYSIQKTLPKLLVMAVLINVSRMICGLFIDISQIITLTFVNAWGENGAGFVEMSKMASFFSSTLFKNITNKDWSLQGVVAGYVIGIGFLLVVGVALIATLGVFLMRMILLWVYVIFSPAAFLLSAFPAGRSYAQKWISGFTQQLIVGPVLAFFVWLAMIISQKQFLTFTSKTAPDGACVGITDITCINQFLPFIISIGIMMVGLMAAQSGGGMAGGAASWGISKIKQGKSWGVKRAKTIGKDTGTKYARTTAGVTGWGMQKLSPKDSSVNKMGKFLGDVRQGSLKKERDAKAAKRINTLKKLGMSPENITDLGKAADSKSGRFVKTLGGAGIVGAGALTANPALMAVGGAEIVRHGVGGLLKNWASGKAKKRKESLESIQQERGKKTESLKQERDNSLKSLKSPEERIEEIEKESQNKIDYYENQKKTNPKLTDTANRQIKNEKKQREEKKREIPEEYKKEKENIENNYNEKLKLVTEKYDKKEKSLKLEEGTIEKIAQKIKPNRVMVEAGEKAGKDDRVAEGRLDVLAKGENPVDMGSHTYYSPGGMTNPQKLFFKKLTAGTDKSRKAIESMTKKMEKIANKEIEIGKKEYSEIRSLKQGMAAFKKDGNSIDALSDIKDVLNRIDNHKDSNNPNVHKTVEDYESTVIS